MLVIQKVLNTVDVPTGPVHQKDRRRDIQTVQKAEKVSADSEP